MFKDRAWFYVGYNPRQTTTTRTATFTAAVPDGGSQTRTFENTPYDRFLRYTVTGAAREQSARPVRRRQPAHEGQLQRPRPRAQRHEHRGAAHLHSAEFSLHQYRLQPERPAAHRLGERPGHRRLDWNVNQKTYVSVTAARLFYGSANAGATQNNAIQRSFTSTNVGLLDVPANLQQPSGYVDGPTNGWAVKDNYGRINVNADVTRYGHFMGEHAFKAGFQWERIENDVDTGSRAPNVPLNWNASRTTSDATPRIVRGTYGYSEIRRIYTAGNIKANNTGIFLQDAWTVNRKLTLNYGVRTESEDIPSYSPKDPGVHFGWADKIAPRVGFAYDVKGDSSLKVYGSWGMFYDITKLEMPRGSWGADHWISYYWTLDTPNWPSISCDGTPGSSNCGGTFIEQVDFRHPSNDSAQPADRSEPEAGPHAGVHRRVRSRADADDLVRRALRAQVAGPHHRGRRHPGAGRRRSLLHRQPRLRHRAADPAATSSRARRRRSATTTASSSACGSASRTAGPPTRAS